MASPDNVFDPDKYLAEKQPQPASTFDPDAYLKEKQSAAAPKDDFWNDVGQGYKDLGKGMLQSTAAFGNSVGNALTGGYYNNLAAGAMTGNMTSPEYVKQRDELNDTTDVYNKENKIAQVAGQIAPAIATGGLLSGAGTAVAELPFVGRAALATGGGAAKGFLQNPGDEHGRISDTRQIPERLVNAETGAITGLGLETVASGAKPALKWAGDKLAKAADDWGFASLRGLKTDVKKAVGKDQVQKIGRELHEQGILSGLPKSSDGLVEATEQKLKEIGPKYGAMLNKASDKAGAMIDRQPIADAVRETLKYKDEVTGLAKKENQVIEDELSQFMGSQKPMTINQAKQAQDELAKLAKWNVNYQEEVPTDVKVARHLYHQIKGSIDDAVDSVSGQIGIGKDQIQALRSSYSNLKTANTIAAGRNLSEISNRYFSPSDYMTGVGGLIAGSHNNGPVGGLIGAGMAVANHVGRKYGAQGIARTAEAGRKVVQGAEGIVNNLGGLSPSQSLTTKGLLLGGGLLKNRANRSPQSEQNAVQ